MKYNIYCFRAEGLIDVERLKKLLPEDKMEIHQDGQFPDVDVRLVSKHSINEPLLLMATIPDSHVMQQTIALEHEYTGVRDYDRPINWKLFE